MPYKFETQKLKIPRELNRTIKLTEKDKEEIKELYKTGKWSHRTLAEKYKVSKTLIGLVLNPERLEAVKKRRKEHASEYYHKEKQKEYKRNERQYKYELYKKNKLF